MPITTDGSYVDDRGKVLFFSLERFKRDICLGDACFVCGAFPGTTPFNDEHVLPQWLLRRFNLHNEFLTLPNSTRVDYGHHTVPCCASCNSLLGREIEAPMRGYMTNGFKALVKNIHHALPVIFQWLCLTVFKNHYRDRLLRMHLDRRMGEGKISDMYDWEELHHIHAVARAAYSGCSIDSEVIGSMHFFGLIPSDLEQHFDFCDLYPSQTTLLRVNDIGIVAVLNDSCGVAQGFIPYSERIHGSVTNIQLREVLSHFAVLNRSIKERPVYCTTFDPQTGEGRITAKVPKTLEFHKPDRRLLGQIMERTCGEIVGKIGGPNAEEKLEAIRNGEYTFLFKDDGTFNDESVVKIKPD